MTSERANDSSAEKITLGVSEESEWDTDLLRLTAFSNAPINRNPEELWNSATEEIPEKISKRVKDGGLEAEGNLQGKTLTLSILQDRIDWFFRPSVEQGPLPRFALSVQPFLESMQRWLKDANFIRRIAFGTLLRRQFPTYKSALEESLKYIHSLRLDSNDETSELLFRINRPRILSDPQVGKLKINRLISYAILSLKSAGVADIGAICHLETDISTDADYKGIFPGEDLSRLFRELIIQGVEIARYGENK